MNVTPFVKFKTTCAWKWLVTLIRMSKMGKKNYEFFLSYCTWNLPHRKKWLPNHDSYPFRAHLCYMYKNSLGPLRTHLHYLWLKCNNAMNPNTTHTHTHNNNKYFKQRHCIELVNENQYMWMNMKDEKHDRRAWQIAFNY